MVVARLAARQHGVVSRQQLLAAGLSAEAIKHRVARERLRRLHAGAFAVGSAPLPPRSRFLAAVLACGDRAVLSHRSAATLLGLTGQHSGPVEVSIPRGASSRRDGITIHATRSLPATDTTTHDNIPCTTWPRTLVDLAAVATPRQLERALEQTMILRLFDLAAMHAALEKANGRRGVGALRRLVAGLDDEPPPTRSELERRFLAIVREAGLPPPVVNTVQTSHEVDFRWPAHKLVVEVDGRATHDTAIAFERDHARDLDLELAGWHVLRFTWRQLLRHADRVAKLLRRSLP